MAQSYGFTYDKLDRLTDARFAEYDYEQECDEYFNFGRYDVSLTYEDHRGNISSISRQGLVSGAGTFGQIDQIAITNDASNNRIESLTESSLQSKGFKGSSGQMGYDSNGNLTSDPSRGITVTNYNRLNLPEQITVSNSSFNGSITFTYDFDGNLLKREVSQSSPTSLSVTTEYVSGMEYVDGSLQSIYHEEGRYVKSGANWHHEYVIRDHLGNNRVFFSDTNGDGFVSMSEVSQESHYYPFGMAMEGSWLSSPLPENKYRYNGIEQTASLGLDVYNAFYRTLDPSLGRWWQVDPKAELHYGDSPYNSMLNNPVLYDDPNGDTPLHLGAAIVGGLFNLGSQFFKGNVTSWGEGLGYFGVGAAAGALYVTPGGQAAGGTLQAIGNKGIQIATGKFDVTEINSVGDVANLALDIGGDYLLVEAGAKIGSNIAVGLKSLVSSYAPSVASGGGAVVKTGVGSAVDDIAFSVGLSDEVVVTAGRVAAKSSTALRPVGKFLQSVDDVIANPSLLKGQNYAQVRGILNGSKGWVNSAMTKTRGVDKGWVFRQVNANGQPTGRLIQYHPGTHRHFGGNPYWKVSDGANVFRFLAN